MPRVLARRISRPLLAISTVLVLLLEFSRAAAFPVPAGLGTDALPPPTVPTGHLVISEVMTGGASASDEFIELYNPSGSPLALDGLEVVYVTASGATVARKASWATGASPIPAGGHLLIANDLGIFLALGDLSYSGGLAATGGSVALRVQGGSSAIDAVGWGTAASTWLETRPTSAPPAGSSLERLPGGTAGSGQDTDDNLLDFAISAVPDPQNSAAPPVPSPSASPSASASPTPTASGSASPTVTPTSSPTPTPSPTASPTPSPTPEPTPAPISIASARALPDGSTVTVEGVTLTDQAFTDGGGFIDDGTAGIAILLSDGSYPRGVLLRVTGVVDDRYSQRTIRTDATGITVVDNGTEPSPIDSATASIGEGVEGRLVRISGEVASAVDTLTTGIALDLDDGSGPARVVVAITTGIDTGSWVRGAHVTLVGVVGQRDSSGSGTAGYRVQPRDPADIVSVEPPATPTPSPSPEASASPTPSASASVLPSPSPTPGSGVVSIAAARAAPYGAHLRIHGVVTAPSGLIDPVSAVLQDATGAILIRLGDEVGTLSRGEVVELDGVRSTLSGMLTLRVTLPPTRLGTQAEPSPLRGGTGLLGEDHEAWLVLVRGAVVTSVLRSTAGTVSFSLDDGSGPLRVSISPRAGISTTAITRGAWFEMRGVLGQETTGSLPDRGYRLWPRIQADIVLIGGAAASPTPQPSASASGSPASGPAPVLTWHSASGSPLQSPRSGALSEGGLPQLTLAMPTASPSASASSIADTRQAASETAPQAAVLLAGAFAMALIAGFLAWRSRRLRPQAAPALEEGRILNAEDEAVPGLGEAAVVPLDALDTHERERILPPI